MSSPLIPNFTIPSIFPFISPTTQSTSPFNSQQQNVLINISNALTSYSNVGTLTGDLFSAANQLVSNGTTLTASVGSLIAFSKLSSLTQNPTAANNAIADLISTESKLSPNTLSGFISSLGSLANLSGPIQQLASDTVLVSNLSTLNTFLTNPSSYVVSLFSTGSIGSSGVSPQKLISDLENSPGTISQDLLTIITNGATPGSPYTSTLSLIEALVSTPGSFVQQFITSSYIISLFPTTNIVSGLTSQKLMSDLLTAPGNVQSDIVTIVTNNTKAGSPYTSPLAVIEAVISNPASFVEQFINGSYITGLFSNTNINVTSPAKLVGDMISNPGNFAGDFSGLFNTGTIGSSGIKPFQIVYDMFTNPGNVLNDFTVVAATGLSTSNVVGGNIAQIFSDIFSVNSRALNNLASDIFSFASLSDFGISGLPNGGIVSILQALQGMFNNFTSIGNALWIGSPAGTTPVPGATYAFLSVDTVYPGYVWWGPDPPSGQPSKPAGYWAADTGGLILPNIGGLQGANYGGQSLQGNLGYIVACLISSYGELDKSFNNAKNAINQISFTGWLGAGESAANSVFNTMNSLYFMSQAVFKMFGILSNVLASFQNIQNMLNQAVAPNYLIPTNPFTGQIAPYTPSASSGILGVLGTIT